MTSVHLLQAEKKDIENVYNLLVEYKNVDLEDVSFPEIDRDKLLNFINTILQRGKIILLNKEKFVISRCNIGYEYTKDYELQV